MDAIPLPNFSQHQASRITPTAMIAWQTKTDNRFWRQPSPMPDFKTSAKPPNNRVPATTDVTAKYKFLTDFKTHAPNTVKTSRAE
jgi:hypothetical protein